MFFRRRSNVIPIAGARDPQQGYTRPKAPPRSRRLRLSPIWIVAPLAIAAGVFFWPGAPSVRLPFAATVHDTDAAHFAHCHGRARRTCVVDGDTIWYEGKKIRIADINAPETSTPSCPQEAALGARATARMTELLNQGPFSLEPWNDGRDTDRYGRQLRVITRGGHSLGLVLVDEGLAERWIGYRRNWC
ncbi:endonuclease YncB(thermonuclease family) [Novosphingobium sp. PhB165]|uniref:thermonuclease family protein n=1 Tax=Novosphingobium sp. PhB165 TaxID=2485105 RepID=UPI00104BBB53|nr:thermonuclease family protein [Novosphingobium sp. PhB165]TCM17158.1 endonuclease YncB(thermonuclease family) [Novosphingobium sp. PhB165]